ncbi:MAG: beta-lactamase family protein [Clostridia bacterium]|nr:beta-lactamase family protein [Clostridia bacterium]
MFKKASPESAGIPSEKILKYLKVINERGLQSHSVLIARGESLVCEAYWKPFDSTVKHRMYSQTKSYVGLAVRILAYEKKIGLDDPIIKYFPDKLPEKIHPYLEKLTIRDMLMMRTCFDEYGVNWFTSGTDDRVKLYFSQQPSVYPGTQYRYDSSGSFVMAALVERITGKIFLDYLRDKCLREIGFSEDAYCLKCPGGWAWGDSALLCTPRDMLLYGRLAGRKGEWNGRQLVPREIFDEALQDESDNFTCGYRSYDNRGYASQFWRFYGNSVAFDGMHDQYTVYDPDTDITFTCTSGNYRGSAAGELLLSYLFTEIIGEAGEALPKNEKACAELEKYTDGLKLVCAAGRKKSSVEDEINGKVFSAEPNDMDIERYSFTFKEDECVFSYKNAQGEKEIVCGRGYNVISQFPETGYSAVTGGQDCPGHTYKCASSFAWGTENQLLLTVQIIDEYIGNLYITFAYRDGYGRMRMVGDAENFLKEYDGILNSFLK